MNTTCSNCRTAYAVPEDKLEGVLSFRCGKCYHRWPRFSEPPLVRNPPPAPKKMVVPAVDPAPLTPAPPSVEVAQPENVQSVFTQPEDDAAEIRKEKRPLSQRLNNLLIWVCLAILVVIGTAALLRHEIIAFFPASAKLFASLGLS